MTKNQKIYLAGIIDGEGYIGISHFKRKDGRKFYKARIIVSNCNLGLLEYIKSFTGGYITKKSIGKKHWTQGYNLTLTYYNDWFYQVVPYLYGKRKKAELFLEAIKLLNKRGFKDREKKYKRIEEINQLLRKKEWEV